jgi:hypothetical protein
LSHLKMLHSDASSTSSSSSSQSRKKWITNEDKKNISEMLQKLKLLCRADEKRFLEDKCVDGDVELRTQEEYIFDKVCLKLIYIFVFVFYWLFICLRKALFVSS